MGPVWRINYFKNLNSWQASSRQKLRSGVPQPALRKNVEMKKEGLFLSCKKGEKGNKGGLVYAEKNRIEKKIHF